MSAKKQYKLYRENCCEIKMEINKGFASFLLTLPFELNYESWVRLHKIKGDGEWLKRFVITVTGAWEEVNMMPFVKKQD